MSGERHRLDVWLWHARCVRTRSVAAELVRAGHVRLNGARVSAPAQPVRLGDVLTIALTGRVRLMKVTGFSERRGDAQAARETYLDLSEPPRDGPDVQESPE
ncbi:RNA-binding S4 domain-containing protein [Ancylobacter sp. Lp-2]|uniref:RNA-binding S4 domain-containing protein n=1 Tax=Ancylobacter sp. Lp-2 TaxID=2881339 RepID=UPI001E4F1DEE|nr:RNA-binding S4 domain-containing protein [Ancylobacter sp. Lp-2]MCB4767598.1 RNA-binding S4 domain-containing protein [Ancylobacter sp. Lp-2]